MDYEPTTNPIELEMLRMLREKYGYLTPREETMAVSGFRVGLAVGLARTAKPATPSESVSDAQGDGA